MPSNIPHRIKQRRKELTLSQDALAKACGVGQSTVANWERGGHIPRQGTLHKIAAALKTDEVWLLSGERANARGPLNTYLTRPIRHVAVFDWPQNMSGLQSALPRAYIAVTVEQDNLFALIVRKNIETFTAGTTLTFTSNYDKSLPGTFLDISETHCRLSTEHSENCTARLIYSFMPH